MYECKIVSDLGCAVDRHQPVHLTSWTGLDGRWSLPRVHTDAITWNLYVTVNSNPSDAVLIGRDRDKVRLTRLDHSFDPAGSILGYPRKTALHVVTIACPSIVYRRLIIRL